MMSWWALPWWVYTVGYEQDLAMMSCAFTNEWFSGTSRELPQYNIDINRATFKNNGKDY